MYSFLTIITAPENSDDALFSSVLDERWTKDIPPESEETNEEVSLAAIYEN